MNGTRPSGSLIVRHAIAWAALWAFWVVVSRHNHPNLLLNALATGLLVATFAAAVYANHLRLIPRLCRRRRFAAYALALLLTMSALALACTGAIHVVYDLIHGPDPARFGFWTNFGMEFAGVTIHVAGAACVVRLTATFADRRAGVRSRDARISPPS